MPTYGLVFPVLPGKKGLAREVSQHFRDHPAEYEESRARSGVTVERAYLQMTPNGAVVLAYLEMDRTFGESMQVLLASDRAIDRYFVDKNSELTGMDFRNASHMSEPELVGQWIAPGNAARARGFAFTAPLVAKKTEVAREFSREAYASRQGEMNESRLAKNMTREEVFLNHTPAGDIIVVYIEGDDPIRANQQFAQSDTPYDRWFKTRCREIFPPFVDFDQPVPANEELFSWVRAMASARTL